MPTSLEAQRNKAYQQWRKLSDTCYKGVTTPQQIDKQQSLIRKRKAIYEKLALQCKQAQGN